MSENSSLPQKGNAEQFRLLDSQIVLASLFTEEPKVELEMKLESTMLEVL